MIINALYFKDFRNLNELTFKCSPRLNIFIGNNGHGKTNIIEGLHFLLEKESFRYGNNLTYIQKNKSTAYLSALLKNAEIDYKIKLVIDENQKKFSINEKPFTQFQNKIPSVVLFSPESLNLIKENSEQRRKLLDHTIKSIFPKNYFVISDFNKVLKSRNKILNDIAKERLTQNEGLKILESYNEIFLNKATDLVLLRLDVLNKLKKEISDILSKLEEKEGIEFDFSYIISEKKVHEANKEYIYSLMQKRMAELRSAELISGTSLVGPQKHDVIFLYNGNDSRFFCSQGQQRSIILAYKMAQIVYHHRVNETYPILLLDDVLSELDQRKQKALIKYLNTIETQTFLTTTDLNSLRELSIEEKFKYEVQDGKILV